MLRPLFSDGDQDPNEFLGHCPTLRYRPAAPLRIASGPDEWVAPTPDSILRRIVAFKSNLGLRLAVTDEERQKKNAICDRLIKEGIDGRNNEEAGARTCRLTDLAGELGREDGIACALVWYEALEKRGVSGKQAIALDFGRANAIASDRYGTNWTWEQPTLVREIFYLRRAISNPLFEQSHAFIKCMCLNNLGNRLRVAGRAIEALDCWRRVIEVKPNFGMSLCNRARMLAFYAHSGALEDRDEQALFYWLAHREASAATAPTADYGHQDVAGVNRNLAKELKEWIESFLDVKEIAALDPLKDQNIPATKEELDYRHWCLANCLYLNPFNDVGPYSAAADDSIGLGAHVVMVDAPNKFQSFFDQMKQEYVSARWLLYEGLKTKLPHFSDRNVPLFATEPRPTLCLAVEKVKAAYRISYSLFDKIGFFMNAYMELGIPERQVTFRTLWRPNDKAPIRREFDQTGNGFFCALYWLSKDFFETANDEVAEPQARRLSEIRNSLEHKYLRITTDALPTAPAEDLALMVPRSQFDAKSVHLLRLARAALIYLSIGVHFEEQRREPSRASMNLEEIPLVPYLPDAEKM